MSRALSCTYIETLPDSEFSPFQDSFASLPSNILDIQARVGSLYLPNQSSIRGATALLVAPGLYFDTLQEYAPNMSHTSNVDLPSFVSSKGVFATSLERDTLGRSGIPLSNSRVLSINGTFTPPPENTSYFVCLFLKHAALARCFNSNCVIDI